MTTIKPRSNSSKLPIRRSPTLQRSPIILNTVWAVWLLFALLGATSAGSQERSSEHPSGPDLERFRSGEIQFPGATWQVVENSAQWGWSQPKLDQAREMFESLESATVMIVHRGVAIAAWGDIAARYNGQSMRKPLLGAMLGQEVAKDRLSLSTSLEDLGIDDSSQSLTPGERQATLRQLLQSTSGIYLSAIYETGGWKRDKPDRGVHAPGEFWYYNNWGFNALGTLFEKVSGDTIHDAFAARIAEPLGMQDYRPVDVEYLNRDSPSEKFLKNDSEHAAYVFMISTRDMARFGLLYQANGRWQDNQVVPADWVRASVSDSVPTLDFLGGDRYAYLWWVSPEDSDLGRAIGSSAYKATGGRGHKAVVVPDLDLLVVHRLEIGGVDMKSQMQRRLHGSPSVSNQEFNRLLASIVAAHPDRKE